MARPVTVSVLVLSGSAAGRVVELSPGPGATIGSDSSAALVLADDGVAPIHAVVTADGPTGATLRTGWPLWVDGVAVSEIALPGAALVDLGSVTLRVDLNAEGWVSPSPHVVPAQAAPPFAPRVALRKVCTLQSPRMHAGVCAMAGSLVLVVGGAVPGPDRRRLHTDAEIIDVARRTTRRVALVSPHLWPSLARLRDGRVLVAGGDTNACEVVSPDGSVRSVARMGATRTGAPAVTLEDGRVVVFGHGGEAAAEIWDPARDTWTAIAGPPLDVVRAVAIPGGALVRAMSGKVAPFPPPQYWRFDGERFVALPGPAVGRTHPELVTLADGRVLVVGGWYEKKPSRVVDVLTSRAGAPPRFEPTGELLAARSEHRVARLGAEGVVIVGGGSAKSGGLSAELWDAATGRWSALPALREILIPQDAVTLDDGSVVVVGFESVLHLTAADARAPRPLEWEAPPPARDVPPRPPPRPEEVPVAFRPLFEGNVPAAVRCAEALAKEHRPTARAEYVPYFVAALGVSSSNIRGAAAKTLAAYGADARAALPALVARLAIETEFLVRAAILGALAAIDPAPTGAARPVLSAIVTHLAARAAEPVAAAAAVGWARAAAPEVAVPEPARYATGVEDAVVAFAVLEPVADDVLSSLSVLARSRNFKIRYAAEAALEKLVPVADATTCRAIVEGLLPIATVFDRGDQGRQKRLAALFASMPRGDGAAAVAAVLESATEEHVFEAVLTTASKHPHAAVAAAVERLAAKASAGRRPLLEGARAKLGAAGVAGGAAAAATVASRLRSWTPLPGRLASTELLVEGTHVWMPILRALRPVRERTDLPPEQLALVLVERGAAGATLRGTYWLPTTFAEARIVSTDAERELRIVARTQRGIVVALEQPFDRETWGREHFLYELDLASGAWSRLHAMPDGWDRRAVDPTSHELAAPTREVEDRGRTEASAHRVGVGRLLAWQDEPLGEVRILCDATPTFLDDVSSPPEAVEAAKRESAWQARLLVEARVARPRVEDVWELPAFPPLVEGTAAIRAAAGVTDAGIRVQPIASWGPKEARVVVCRLEGGGQATDGLAVLGMG